MPSANKRKPVTYTAELGLQLCEAIAMRQSPAEICAQAGMPSERTVYVWRRQHPEFATAYEEARRWRAEARADHIDALAQRLEAGKLDPQTARTLFDIERWQASKEAPGRYSEKTTAEITGKDGAAIAITSEPSEIETARRIAMLLGIAMQRLEGKQKQIEGATKDE